MGNKNAGDDNDRVEYFLRDHTLIIGIEAKVNKEEVTKIDSIVIIVQMAGENGQFALIAEEGFFMPKLDDYDAERRIRGLKKQLDTYAEEGRGTKGFPGELLRVINLNQDNLEVAVFDIMTGQQIGYNGVWVSLSPLQRMRGFGSINFETITQIASKFSACGLSSLARSHVKTFLASKMNSGRSAALVSEVRAAIEDRTAVRTMLEHSGAKLRPGTAAHDVGDVWVEVLKTPPGPIPTSLYVDNVVFRKGDEVKRLDSSAVSDPNDYASWQPVQDQWLQLRAQGYGARSEFDVPPTS